MFKMTFTPFRQVRAEYNRAGVVLFLQDVARSAHHAFRVGSEASNGGSVYRGRGGVLHRASAPGAWPAKNSGRLLQSIRTVVTMTEATIGTNTEYSGYLRHGTRKMSRRKMSDDAIKAGVLAAKPRQQAFGKFRVV